MPSARAATLVRVRDLKLTALEARITAWVAAGSPPTFSIDGESYDFVGWERAQWEDLKALDAQIAGAAPPYVVSRQRG